MSLQLPIPAGEWPRHHVDDTRARQLQARLIHSHFNQPHLEIPKIQVFPNSFISLRSLEGMSMSYCQSVCSILPVNRTIAVPTVCPQSPHPTHPPSRSKATQGCGGHAVIPTSTGQQQHEQVTHKRCLDSYLVIVTHQCSSNPLSRKTQLKGIQKSLVFNMCDLSSGLLNGPFFPEWTIAGQAIKS